MKGPPCSFPFNYYKWNVATSSLSVLRDAVPEGFLGNNYAVFPWIGCDKPDCTYCGEGWENLCN